jgi:thiamine-phosphate diphosphorylase
MTEALRLYLVADPEPIVGDVLATVEAALRGGVTAVQLRAKCLPDREQVLLARHLKAACRAYGVPLLVNDRLDIALAAGADGVHLGVDDLPVSDARRIAGPGFLIGYSPETDAQVLHAAASGADYLGIGPVFGTATKPDAGPALGLEAFARRCQQSALPVVGIGGISAGNAADVMRAGATGVAVISAIIGAPDPEQSSRDLLRQVDTSVR